MGVINSKLTRKNILFSGRTVTPQVFSVAGTGLSSGHTPGLSPAPAGFCLKAGNTPARHTANSCTVIQFRRPAAVARAA